MLFAILQILDGSTLTFTDMNRKTRILRTQLSLEYLRTSRAAVCIFCLQYPIFCYHFIHLTTADAKCSSYSSGDSNGLRHGAFVHESTNRQKLGLG
jgi:hypothetical protein